MHNYQNSFTNTLILQFLTKQTSQKLCKRLYDETILKIVIELRNQYLQILIDEITDDTGRHVANIVIGILSSNDYESRKRFY